MDLNTAFSIRAPGGLQFLAFSVARKGTVHNGLTDGRILTINASTHSCDEETTMMKIPGFFLLVWWMTLWAETPSGVATAFVVSSSTTSGRYNAAIITTASRTASNNEEENKDIGSMSFITIDKSPSCSSRSVFLRTSVVASVVASGLLAPPQTAWATGRATFEQAYRRYGPRIRAGGEFYQQDLKDLILKSDWQGIQAALREVPKRAKGDLNKPDAGVAQRARLAGGFSDARVLVAGA